MEKRRKRIRLKTIGRILSLALISFFHGCVDEIVFDVPKEGGQLIISGTITNGNLRHTVTIARTSSKGGIPVPVTGASVWIEDDQGNREQLIESYVDPHNPHPVQDPQLLPDSVPGEYSLLGNIVRGEMTRSYELEIVLEDGTTYRSQPDTLPSVLANDTPSFEIGTETVLSSDGVVSEIRKAQLFLDSELPAKPIYIKWNAEHVYIFRSSRSIFINELPIQVEQFCFVTDHLNTQGFVLFDGRAGVAINLDDQLIGSKTISDDFFYISYLNAIQSSMSKDAFIYWEQVKDVAQNVGTIFDVPGATPVGNVFNVNNPDEEVLGRFSAIARDTAHIALSSADFSRDDFLISDPCINFFDPSLELNQQPCIKCLVLDNSRLRRPDYW